MRVMMFVKGDQEPGQLPSEELLAAMGRYNEELTKAGVLLDLSGLHPSAEGVRVKRVPVEAAEHEYGQESEIEIRQIFELEEFGESPAIDRARELEKELEKKK
jgi:hypothetical protein